MSEDDYSGAVGRGTGDTSQQKKGPRFSWTPAYEATFFRSLCESVTLGLKDNHSFKQEAWDRAMQALQDRHGAYPNKGHLINKSDNARKKFRLWRGLREDPEFLYNPATRTVTANDDAWRAHVEKEPLSRSLKGRPFEHEEFYEILFPDVIGSGGAPKRVTKPRRKGPDALPGDGDQDTPGTAILHLLNDGYAPTTQAPPAPTAISARPHNNAIAAANVAGQPRPTQAAIPPRGTIASSSALTPPDETTPHTRKRFLAPDPGSQGPADKRRRTTNTNSVIDLTHSANQAGAAAAAARGDSIAVLAEALAKASVTAAAPRYPEQAMDIFFREFAEEDMDLQVKIAEKMLTDPNKAVLFVKMPSTLRKHWVKRLREAHNRVGN